MAELVSLWIGFCAILEFLCAKSPQKAHYEVRAVVEL